MSFYLIRQVCCEGDVKSAVRLFERQRVSVAIENEDGETPLFLAVKSGNIAVAEYLISRGASVNHLNAAAVPPLWCVIRDKPANQLLIVGLLLKNGADVNFRTKAGESLVMLTVKQGHLAVLKLMLEEFEEFKNDEEKGDPLAARDSRGRSVLACAVDSEFSFVPVIKFLLECRKQDVESKDLDGNSPLHAAAANGNVAALELLLEAGASLDSKNSQGLTPLQVSRGSATEFLSNLPKELKNTAQEEKNDVVEEQLPREEKVEEDMRQQRELELQNEKLHILEQDNVALKKKMETMLDVAAFSECDEVEKKLRELEIRLSKCLESHTFRRIDGYRRDVEALKVEDPESDKALNDYSEQVSAILQLVQDVLERRREDQIDFTDYIPGVSSENKSSLSSAEELNFDDPNASGHWHWTPDHDLLKHADPSSQKSGPSAEFKHTGAPVQSRGPHTSTPPQQGGPDTRHQHPDTTHRLTDRHDVQVAGSPPGNTSGTSPAPPKPPKPHWHMGSSATRERMAGDQQLQARPPGNTSGTAPASSNPPVDGYDSILSQYSIDNVKCVDRMENAARQSARLLSSSDRSHPKYRISPRESHSTATFREKNIRDRRTPSLNSHPKPPRTRTPHGLNRNTGERNSSAMSRSPTRRVQTTTPSWPDIVFGYPRPAGYPPASKKPSRPKGKGHLPVRTERPEDRQRRENLRRGRHGRRYSHHPAPPPRPPAPSTPPPSPDAGPAPPPGPPPPPACEPVTPPPPECEPEMLLQDATAVKQRLNELIRKRDVLLGLATGALKRRLERLGRSRQKLNEIRDSVEIMLIGLGDAQESKDTGRSLGHLLWNIREKLNVQKEVIGRSRAGAHTALMEFVSCQQYGPGSTQKAEHKPSADVTMGDGDGNTKECLGIRCRNGLKRLREECEKAHGEYLELKTALDEGGTCTRSDEKRICESVLDAIKGREESFGQEADRTSRLLKQLEKTMQLTTNLRKWYTPERCRKYERLQAQQEPVSMEVEYLEKLKQFHTTRGSKMPIEQERKYRDLREKLHSLRTNKNAIAFRKLIRRYITTFPELGLKHPSFHPSLNFGWSPVDFSKLECVDVLESEVHELLVCRVKESMYESKGLQQGQNVVLKRHKEDEKADAELHNLSRTLGKVYHKSVVRLLGIVRKTSKVGKVEHFAIFPYLEGGNLRAWLRHKKRIEWASESELEREGLEVRGRLTPKERQEVLLVSMFRQILDAVAHLHERGVVHLHLNPENILLTATQQPVINDFLGAVCLESNSDDLDSKSDASHRDKAQGKALIVNERSIGYADPFAKAPSRMSDVYSVGVMLAEAWHNWDPTLTSTSIGAHHTEHYQKLTRCAAAREAERKAVPSWEAGKDLDSEEMLVSVLLAMLNPDYTKRMSARDLLAQPFFSDRDFFRLCSVCYDDEVLLKDGLECEAGHFLCKHCLSSLVDEFASLPPTKIQKKGGQVNCPSFQCTHKFSDEVVFDHLPNSDKARVMEKLMEARLKVREGALAVEIERVQRDKFEKKFNEWKTMSDEERTVATHRSYIIENILNMRCPRCKAVFYDFTGCFAVTCPNCAAGFCAWCLTDCGKDAHRHVIRCPLRRNVRNKFYGRIDDFHAVHKERRMREIRAYLSKLPDKMQKKVAAKCLEDWKAIGIGEIAAYFL